MPNCSSDLTSSIHKYICDSGYASFWDSTDKSVVFDLTEKAKLEYKNIIDARFLDDRLDYRNVHCKQVG